MPANLNFLLQEEFGRRDMLRADLATFPPNYWWQDGEPLPAAKGRAGVRVLRSVPGLRLATRDYQRGGALSFLLTELYLDSGRAQRELELLTELLRRGVSVAVPVAALSKRRFLFFHRLRLVTELLEDAVPLPTFLAEYPKRRNQAVRLAGALVQSAFAAGLNHPDLHPDNLVARERWDGEVEMWLLDLDRCKLQDQLSQEEEDAMLVRMARYLRRHAADLPVAMKRSDFLRFMSGMGLDKQQRRQRLQSLVPMYQKQLQRRGLA